MTLRMHRSLLREYESGVELVHSLFDQSMAHGDPEDDHLRGERAERGPDIAKCKDEWSFLSGCDDETDPKDGKGRGRLDKHRRDAGIHF